ncbi:hypothetical protein MKW92_046424, partial [Papaver armeniacum]
VEAEPEMPQATQPDHQPTPMQNTNVVNRAEGVEKVTMRPGGCKTMGGGIFSSFSRGAPSTTQTNKRKNHVANQSSPVRRSNRICGGLS